MRPLRVSRLLLPWLLALTLVACNDGDDADNASSTTTAGRSAPDATRASATTATSPSSAASRTVTENGLGKLRLDMTLADARETGEIGSGRPGCELAGSGEIVADLNTGVDGLVYFNDDLLTGIVVRNGATTAAGVGPGSTIAEIQQAYGSGYEVKVDRSTEEVFGVAVVSVLRGTKQVFGFDVPPDTGKARSLAMPAVRACE